tara:strand:- start:1486 stop:2145 length:660 start_codon:yes stop_codon:yes gene_type:complete
MKYLDKIIAQLNTAEWWVILAIVFSMVLYVYEPIISKVAEHKFISTQEDAVEVEKAKASLVNPALEKLRYITGSDIAFVVLFHNGVTYTQGDHKIKMSRDFEMNGPGIMPRAEQYQNVPVTLFLETLNDIEGMRFHYNDISDVNDMRTRLRYEEYGVSATSIAPYYNKDGDLVALIGVEYVSRKPDEAMILWRNGLDKWDTDVMWDLFYTKTNEIGGLL